MPESRSGRSLPTLNRYSATVTQDPAHASAQAMLHAAGLSREDLSKAQVGIASMWWEGNPCNMHLLDLAQAVREGVADAGLIPMRFNTIGVSDGISMGTDGMSYSLPSRDLIADSIETVMRAQWYDANVSIPGCDKNMPGALMAMARVDRPSIMVYGGTIRAGHLGDESLDIVSAFESYGALISGQDRRAPLRGCRPERMPRGRRMRRHVHGQHDGERGRGARHDAAVQRFDASRGPR
jgi:dihydroxy-acid dehydratase